MAIQPQTNVFLLKCPLLIDNKNQLNFISKEAQHNYFSSLPKLEIDNVSFQRKDSVIRYPAHIDTLLQYNYCMYQNENYGDKWFYAYISNMTYVNDNRTDIQITTDCFQTWQFDINYKSSFIEREHVNDDTIGLHTIEENLNVGEVIQESVFEDVSLSAFHWVGILTSWNPATEKQFAGITIYNKQIFGKQLFVINAQPISNLRNLLAFILKTNIDTHIGDISDIFFIPDALIDPSQLIEHQFTLVSDTFSFYELPYSNSVYGFTTSINKRTSFSDFTPKNNKCFVFPYNYLFVSNNVGNQNIFKYEDFQGNTADFQIQLALSIGCSGRAIPLNYRGKASDDDEALPLAKYPVCSWSADSYTNWLTQQCINVPTQLVNIVASPFLSNIDTSSSKEVGAQALNTINQIGSLIGSFYQASIMPNIEGGGNTGDVNFAADRNTFTYRQMRAKTEYLQIIDNFFSMYGYKVNATKTPNITGRRNWNYVKTTDINLIANIPQEDLQQIKNMFNNGVTFWHNVNTFLDYTQNNDII